MLEGPRSIDLAVFEYENRGCRSHHWLV
jgi:hypothetical protein